MIKSGDLGSEEAGDGNIRLVPEDHADHSVPGSILQLTPPVVVH